MATAGNGKTITGHPSPQNPTAVGYSAGTYPYAVPPPSSYSSFYQEPLRTHFNRPPPPVWSSFFCRLLASIAAFFIVVSLIVFVTWLILKPHLPAVRVDSASVTSLNATAASLSGRWDITLVVRNPNHKLSISYDTLDAEVWYGEEDRVRDLASTRMPPFSQGTRSETSVRVQFAVDNEYVDNGVAKGIAADRARGSVQFGVTLMAWVRFKSGILRSRDHLLTVYCDPVSIRFSPNNGTGTLMRGLNCE